ncbi:Histone deacetylase complex subunit SAP18 isoform B [Chlorella sorokiniana]|uniref:Histone deacetylase complex subunit SAP18 isoform A n=1 Tax=Chlorella sorokiniana TaxID=3076 RepID=A0A2P6U3M4_CHLSO|nr:Histone deacetylase complex subunit SAP18 isoform A [Chlorella sorokiniana]PRW60918.1 Histone deacetylase complex subunit SAP18 isoform B [Chlorella sorokiniana]|eukprot:PRW60917.1 Histone deacetylase complex subunit SAP18 isoform A [Chlorella sorokiniana]
MYRRDFDRRGPPPDYGYDRRGPPPPDFGRGGFDDRRLGPPPPGYGGPPLDMPGPAVRSGVVAVHKEPAIDREKVCPLLLRVFPRLGAHHQLEDFARRGDEPKDEVQVYTWMDATLRELSDLVKEVQPAARRPMARISFAFIYPDRRGKNVMRQVGAVHATRLGEDDSKTLKQLNFQTGDFLSVAIY